MSKRVELPEFAEAASTMYGVVIRVAEKDGGSRLPTSIEVVEIRHRCNHYMELVEELEEAKRSILQVANDAVELLNQHAPDMGWDPGEKTAEMYTRRIDRVLAKAKGE